MATIDEKIVQLKLDDSQFDKASSKTISKLDELKKALTFDGAVDGFKELDKAAKQMDLSPIEKGVQAVTHQFSVLATVADAAIRQVVTRGLYTLENTLKSLTIDNITAGWDKYGEKTAAVQTIMAATAKEFGNVDNQMELVEKQLEKLNWFTDETSYRFLDMVNNIGKFTSNSVALETSVTAMQGISTWAARSGANVNEAGRAMYNLSQAISVGAVKLIDWKSIENANMATAEFKETAIETAEVLGTLTKAGDGLYKTLTGKEVSVKNFNENLSEGWFTSDVLLKTLDTYGGFANRLYELTEATDVATTSLIGMVDSFEEGTLNINDAAATLGMTVEETTDLLTDLSSEEYKIGRAAFKAAQESKTFADVMDYVKESVSSGWMRTFEYIFGNYEEAKEIWSELAEGMYDVFVASGDMRNGVLRDWKALGGRTYLIDGVRELLSKIVSGIELVKSTFRSIFPAKTAEQLYSMTEGFKKFVNSLTLGESTIKSIQNAITPFFKALQKLGQVAVTIFSGLEPIWSLLGQISLAVIGLAGDIGNLISLGLDKLFSPEHLQTLYDVIYLISSIIAALVRGSLSDLVVIVSSVAGFIKDIWDTFQSNGGGIQGFIAAIVTNFQALFNRVQNGDSIINTFINKVVSVAKSASESIGDVFSSIFDSIANGDFNNNPIIQFFVGIGEAIQSTGLVENLQLAVGAIILCISELFGMVGTAEDLGTRIKSVIQTITEQLQILWNWLVTELQKLGFRDIADIALIVFLGQFVNSLDNLNKKLAGVASSLSGTLSAATNAINVFAGNGANTITNQVNNFVKNTKYLQMAFAIGVLVDGLIRLSEVDPEKLGVSVVAIAAVLGSVTLLMKAIEKLSSASGGSGGGGNNGMKDASNNMIKFALGIALLAEAVAIMSSAIGDGKNGWKKMAQAIGGLAALMIEMLGFILVLNAGLKAIGGGTGTFAMVAGGMIIFSGAMLVLVQAVKQLVALQSEFEEIDIGDSVKSIAALLVSMGLAAALMSKVNAAPILAASVAMIGMSAALNLLMEPILTLAQMPFEKYQAGLTSVAILLAGLIGAFTLLGGLGSHAGSILAAGVAAIGFAAAANILVDAILKLASIKDKGEMISTAAGLIVGGLVAFGGAAAIATAASAGLFALAALFVALGASFALFAVGVKTLVEAVGELVALVSIVMLVSDQMGDDLPAKIEEALSLISMIVQGFLKMIPAFAMELTHVAAVLIGAFMGGIALAFPDLLNGLMLICTALLEVIANLGEPLVDALGRAIDGIAAGMPALIAGAAHLVRQFLAGIGVIAWEGILGLIEMLLNALGLGFVGEMITSRMESIGEGMIDDLYEGSKAAVDNADWEGIADDATDSVSVELRKKKKDLYNAAYDSSSAIEAGTRDSTDVHSLSPKFMDIGNWITDSLGQGLLDGEDGLYSDAFSSMGAIFSGMMDGIAEGEVGVSNALDGLLQMVGYKTSKIKAEIYEVKNAIYEVDQEGNLVQTGRRRGPVKETSTEKVAEEAGIDVGTSFDEGIASGISSSGASTKATTEKVKTLTETLDEQFKEQLDALDLADKLSKSEYNLWESLNVNADEVEKKMKEIDLATQQVETQVERTTIAEKKYNEIVKQLGEESSESKEALIEWQDAQTELNNTRSEIVSLQNDIIDLNTKALEDELARLEEVDDLQYELWQALNDDAGEAAKSAAEIEYNVKKVAYQSQKLSNSEKKWKEATKDSAKTAEEISEAYKEYLQDQIDYTKAQNTLTDLQEAAMDKNTQLLEQLNYQASLTEKRFSLYNSMNSDATEAQKTAAEIQKLQAQIQNQVAVANVNADEYNKAVNKYGSGSKEAQDAYLTYLESLESGVELHEQLVEKQKSAQEDQTAAWQRLGVMMTEDANKVDEQGNKVMGTAEFLRSQGFSEEQIMNQFKYMAGVVEQATDEELVPTVEEAAMQAADILAQYGEVTSLGLANIAPKFTEATESYITNMTTTMSLNTDNVVNAAKGVVDATVSEISSESYYAQWIEIGYQAMMGIKEGITNGESAVINEAIRVVQQAIMAARATAGIASPAKEFIFMGEMMDLGLVKGIEHYAGLAAKASANVMAEAMKRTSDAIGTSNTLEFIGGMVAGGLARGFDNYSSQVLEASQDLIDRTQAEFDDLYSDKEKYLNLFREMGFDPDDLSFDIVMNLDTDKAYSEMNALERAISNYYSARRAELYAQATLVGEKEDLKYLKENSSKYSAEDYEDAYVETTNNIEEATAALREASKAAWEAESSLKKQIGAAQGDSSSSISGQRISYTQNIYSSRPLSTLDIYRNTNKQLQQFS